MGRFASEIGRKIETTKGAFLIPTQVIFNLTPRNGEPKRLVGSLRAVIINNGGGVNKMLGLFIGVCFFEMILPLGNNSYLNPKYIFGRQWNIFSLYN